MGAKGKGRKGTRRAPNRLEHLNTVPDVVDVMVRLPPAIPGVAESTDADVIVDGAGGRAIELRCVSTDKLHDVRLLLSELPELCHATNFTFRHAQRGDRLKEDTEVIDIKPAEVAVVEKNRSSSVL